MARAKPCSHARRALVDFRAVKVQLDQHGSLIAWGDTPDMKHWAVLEDWRCAKCGHVEWRCPSKGFGEPTERKALQRYGVKPAALPPPPNYRAKPAVFVPQPHTAWPFPVSAHTPRPHMVVDEDGRRVAEFPSFDAAVIWMAANPARRAFDAVPAHQET